MASIEYQKPDPDKTPHLHFLVPYIRGFRQEYTFSGCSDDIAHNDEWLEKYVREFDKEVFFSYVKNNLQEICLELNSRWLLSILYCYVDGHEDKEVQLQALAAANAVEFDRMHMSSLHSLHLDREDFADNFSKFRRKVEVFDGLILYIGHADVLNNFYYRSEKLITHPEVDKIYRTLTKRFCNSWLSLHAGMILNSGRETTRRNRNLIVKNKQKFLEKLREKIESIRVKVGKHK